VNCGQKTILMPEIKKQQRIAVQEVLKAILTKFIPYP
jgi:hypothetical protein